ncbi:MAG: ferredoxin [Desulfuromonadaceae bacterium]|nr:ferredoxin [Desulfuromonadaceae bacterium]MDD2849056.1 ferredoxin [Desulfuromonadaceae bacterium]MDD4131786.1 ferredoxin [Desulfuromonadaceae bacterium]
MKKPWVDQEACVSGGLCVNAIPEVFRFAGHGKAEVYDPGGAYQNVIQEEVIDICPVSCIQWLDK